jgi:hypothetical protein
MPMGWGPLSTRGFGGSPDLSLATLYKVPASQTPEGKERIRAYYEALGRFVDKFARVEAAVAHTLWVYAQSPARIAKVIFAGTRVEGGATYIKQIVESAPVAQEVRDDLSDVLQQLGTINRARNMILHYGAENVAEGSAMVSDALKARGEPSVFPISPELLGQMTDDLDKIIIHLNLRHLGRTMLVAAENRAAVDEVFQRPWRYKHHEPPKAHSKTSDDPQRQTRASEQPRQPRPSRASRRRDALKPKP